MGEDICIYVKKDRLNGLWFATQKINNFGNRWHWLKEKLRIDDYPFNKTYWTAEDILSDMAGKEVKEEYVSVIKDLIGKDTIIQGDYSDFPKDKNENDYVDLTMLLWNLFNKFKEEQDTNQEKK